MPNPTKGNTLRLYLRDDELTQLGELTEALEIPQTEVMSRIMTAGIRALVENGKRMPLPLKFYIVEGQRGDYQANETQKEKHRR